MKDNSFTVPFGDTIKKIHVRFTTWTDGHQSLEFEPGPYCATPHPDERITITRAERYVTIVGWTNHNEELIGDTLIIHIVPGIIDFVDSLLGPSSQGGDIVSLPMQHAARQRERDRNDPFGSGA